MHVSLPVIMTQSYDSVDQIYTETFSVGLVKVPANKRLVIRNIVNQGFYFKTVNAIDTPVTVAIFSSERLFHEVIKRLHPDFNIEADSSVGEYTAYDGSNDSILKVASKGVNHLFPHRFAIFEADESDYDIASAKALISGPEVELHEAILTQGSSFSAPSKIQVNSQSSRLYIVPFLASLKRTELACASRIAFDIEELD